MSNWFNDQLRIDSEILVAPPSGRFVLHSDHGNDLILFAGGSGISPILSIIKTALQATNRNIQSPKLEVFCIESSEFTAHMNKRFKLDLKVHLSAQKSQVDCRPLSLISQQTCDQLSSGLDMDISYRRFRPNFLINWANGEGFHENTLIGKRLKIGDRCEVTFLERDPRCKMVTLDPDTGDGTPKTLKHVTLAHEGYAGVYGAVLVEGVVKAGDKITLIDG